MIAAGSGLAGAGLVAAVVFHFEDFTGGPEPPRSIETAAGPSVNDAGGENASFPACRHPMHGLDSWREQATSKVDSGWKLDLPSPAEFCERERMKLQTEFPSRTIELADLEHTQRRESEFNVLQDRTVCHFRSSWHPVYKLARSKYCSKD